MLFKKVIAAIILAAFFKITIQEHCRLCPRIGRTPAVINCNCSSGSFYDETTEKCVKFSDCPRPPLSKIQALLQEIISDVIDSLSPVLNITEDTIPTNGTFNESVDEIEENLTNFLDQILESVFDKKDDFLDGCKENITCIMEKTLAKINILSTLNTILEQVAGNFRNIMNQAKHMMTECEDKSDQCEMIKAIKKFLERTLGEINNIRQLLINQ